MQASVLRVLFLTSDSSAVAGVGPCLADALENIDRSLVDPFVVCPWEEQGAATIHPRLQALSVPIVIRDLGKWLPSPDQFGWSNFLRLLGGMKSRVWSLVRLIEREKIDCIYTNGLPCIDGALAARLTKRPHIWHLHEAIRHNSDLRRYVPAWLVEEFVGRLSCAVIVNSHFLLREFKRTSHLTTVKVVHNGVDLSGCKVTSPNLVSVEVRKELGINLDAPIVLAVGTVAPRKGYTTLIEAASIVLYSFPNVLFLIAGAEVTEHAAVLRELIGRKGLHDKVRLLGPRKDIPRLMIASDMVAHSAYQETFGRVLVEAMASGKPVVATRCGGPEEIVIDGETGYLVPVGDEIALADRIKRILSDPEIGARMGEAGRRRAKEQFSVQAYARNIQKIIEEVAASSC